MDNNEQNQTTRKRARGMNVDERRAMIVRTALPLLAEVGPSVTTLQIARAAGISEPTIFRAFADKNEVLQACLEEVTKPEHIAIELEAIDLEAGLDERLAEMIDIIRLQGERTGAVLNAIRLANPAAMQPRGEEARRTMQNWKERYGAIHEAVCRVLEPDEHRLRLPVADFASLVLTIVMMIGRAGGITGFLNVSTKQLADLLLHGAVK